MTFQDYYRNLSSDNRDKYSKYIGISRKYIEIHLMKTQRRNPSTSTMQRMAEGSNGALTYMEVVTSFPPICKKEVIAS